MLEKITLQWNNGSINDNIIKWCKKHSISFRFNHYNELELNYAKGFSTLITTNTKDTISFYFG